MKTPILFLIFNRPETTFLVFEAIRQQRPQFLYIAADAPRQERPQEKEKCELARSIVNKIDWPCEVKTRFLSDHLGCKYGVSSAISWFFEQVEEGIILEDDCLPTPDFFPYCEELLQYYRHDSRIMHICGVNFLFKEFDNDFSYRFSQLAHIWGWASWRRAWKFYDLDLDKFVYFDKQKLFSNDYMDQVSKNIFINSNANEIDTWDYQWGFSVISNNGLCISPRVNMISNIGFSKDALHTTDINSKYSLMAHHPMSFPLKHCPVIIADYDCDVYEFLLEHPQIPTWQKIITQTKYYLRRIAQIIKFW